MKRKPLHHRKRFWNFIQAPQTTRGQLMNEPEWHIRSGLAIRPLGYHEVAIQSLSGDVFTEHAMLLPGSLQPTCWLLLLMKLWQMQWCWERGLWASSVVQLEVHYIFMLLKKLPSYQGKKKKESDRQTPGHWVYWRIELPFLLGKCILSFSVWTPSSVIDLKKCVFFWSVEC